VDVSPQSPDDLAVFAVDALETDELKAFDARLDARSGVGAAGGPDELAVWREVLGGLAATAVEQPPTSLRARLLDAALAKRPTGTPIAEVDEIQANEAYRRTVAAIGALLVELTPDDWNAPTIEGWTVKGLVAHLVAVEEYFGRQLGLWPHEVDQALEADHLGMTRAFVASWTDRPAPEVLARWQELTGAITDHLGSLDRSAGRQPFHFHYLDAPLSTILITRVFEIWTHEEDIRRATGRALAAPEPARLRRMSRIAVPSIPFGLALAGDPAPGRTARVVLTGLGGGTWDQALGWGETAGTPEATLVLDVVDYCRLAARRVGPDDVTVTVEGDGDLARRILAGAGVFSA
jgi:uncharacterized protein (TIGR03083 family)